MKHTILFLAANPRDTDPLALQEECAAIERELRKTAGRDCFDFQSRWAVSVDDLMDHLNHLSPTILHFSGHGTSEAPHVDGATYRDAASPRPAGILLQSKDGSQYVGEQALAEMITSASRSTRLVVLNACHSAAVADTLSREVDCVVGVEGAIEDGAARSFAVAFYRALGYHRSVGNAVAQATATLAAQPRRAPVVCRTRDGFNKDELHITHAPATSPEPPVPADPIPFDGYDLFLAHPSAIKASAVALHDLLTPGVRVFLTGHSPASAQRWDASSAAQFASRATVLLTSRQSDAAWYLGEEVINAIAQQRASPRAERVLLVQLEPGVAVPHLLCNAPMIDAGAMGGMTAVAAQLERRVEALRRTTPPTNSRVGSSSSPPVSHFRLYDRLRQLTRPTFEQIASRAGTAWEGRPATANSDHVLDLAQLAALDAGLHRQLTSELDRRAPWTRR